MRGEYTERSEQSSRNAELPPHARRILVRAARRPRPSGTTSACAENTQELYPPANLVRNYLRMRGEYLSGNVQGGHHWELPPHARRIRANTTLTT